MLTPGSGSVALCQTLGPSIVRLYAAFKQGANAAYNAGLNDTQVLSGTTARYGGAFKRVEDDAEMTSDAYRDGMDASTKATIDTDGLQLENEQKFAQNSVQAYVGALAWINSFGQLALEYERAVNSRNRNASLARLNEALAGMPRTATSTTNANVNCFGNNCTVAATTTTNQDTSAAVEQQRASRLSMFSLQQATTIDQITPTLIDYTSQVQVMAYKIRVDRARWESACPNLEFPAVTN